MRFGSLFAGIGGLDLGLERAGMECAWQVEIDPFCRRILSKHWPAVPKFRDVTTFCRRAENLESIEGFISVEQLLEACGRVDVIAGGFPCQDISQIGKRAGIGGSRSGLWGEFARIIRALRPGFVIAENVSRLLRDGAARVLSDLDALGYDAEWDCLPAFAVGAPHRRDRVFIVAHARRAGLEGHAGHEVLAGDAGVQRGERWAFQGGPARSGRLLPGVDAEGWWTAEPGVGRVAHGVPDRVDRIKTLGNAIVPQVAEWIGRRILEVA